MPSNSFEPPTIKLPGYRRLFSDRPVPPTTTASSFSFTHEQEPMAMERTMSLPRSANRAGSRGHNRRVCPLTSFRVTTDSSGDIKRQFKNDWKMTHDASAIGVDIRSFIIVERDVQHGDATETKRRGGGPVRYSLTSSQDMLVTPVAAAGTRTMTTSIPARQNAS